MYQLGLDLSTKKIALVGSRHNPLVRNRVFFASIPITIKLPGACQQAYWQTYKYLEPRKGGIAYVESPVVAGARNLQTTIKLSLINGAVIVALQNSGYSVQHVAPSTWKKDVLGNGAANKQDVADWIADHWPELHASVQKDQDLIDAACIYLAGRQAATA